MTIFGGGRSFFVAVFLWGLLKTGLNASPGGEPGGIQGLEAVLLSPRSARVSWRTATFSDSELSYGKNAQLGEAPIVQPKSTRQHVVLLTGLEPGTRYFYQASSEDGEGRLSSAVTQFTTLAAPAYTVRDSHPRIFFQSDDLDSLREKIGGSHKKYWRILVSYCNKTLLTDAHSLATNDNLVTIGRALAFAGLVGDDAKFRRKAEEMALESARLSVSGWFATRNSLLLMATVHDWLYQHLSDCSRSILRNAILERLRSIHPNDQEFVWGTNPLYFSPIALGALSIHGDAPEAQDYLDEAISRYRYDILPAWRHYANDGGSNEGWWYTTYHLDMLVDALWALETGTNANLLPSEAWLAKLAEWYSVGLRSDKSFQRSGDTKLYLGLHYMNRRFAAFAAKTFQDPKAQWLANKIEEDLGTWGPTAVNDILGYDTGLEAQPPFEKTTHFYPEAGFVLARDTWGPDSVQVMFRSARDFTLGHTHRDNNSFTIYYRAGQAIGSGVFDDASCGHQYNYYERSIAHNTILVFDPQETFRRYSTTLANDGGQRYLTEPDQVPSVTPGTIEDVLDPSKGYQAGGISFEEATQDYTYAMGDAAPSYGAEKLKAFDRHLVFLKSVAGYKKPLTIVFDRVVSTNASFRKSYLLHTQGKPAVAGDLVSATNGGGMIYQQTLLPEARTIDVVGGPGKEYWVDGQNYAPIRTPKPMDEAGSYRVEVSPSAPALEDFFLHLLYAADAGTRQIPPAQRIQASGMLGLRAGNWQVLFPAGKPGISTVTYELPDETSKNLLVGMVPLATYDLMLDGEKEGEEKASYEGTLYFETEGGGTLSVKKSQPPSPSPADFLWRDDFIAMPRRAPDAYQIDASPSALQLVAGQAPGLGIQLDFTDPLNKNGKAKAELGPRLGDKIMRYAKIPFGEERWHAVTFRIPADWKSDGNKVNVISFHGTEDRGETGIGRTGNLNVFIARSTLFGWRSWCSEAIQTRNENRIETFRIPFQPGHSYRFIFHTVFDWHPAGNGLSEIWVSENGGPVRQLFHEEGPNGYNDREGPYFKFGVYVPSWNANERTKYAITVKTHRLTFERLRMGKAGMRLEDFF